MEAIPTMRKSLFISLGVLQAFIGVGAVAGGLGLALDPSGESLGIPLELLEETPFATFLIPGIVLFAVNGLCCLTGAIASFTRHRYAEESLVPLDQLAGQLPHLVTTADDHAADVPRRYPHRPRCGHFDDPL